MVDIRIKDHRTLSWYPRCPRCSGQVLARRDGFGPYTTCLHCGLHRYPEGVTSPTLYKGGTHQGKPVKTKYG